MRLRNEHPDPNLPAVVVVVAAAADLAAGDSLRLIQPGGSAR
jgi:hypothetical protein